MFKEHRGKGTSAVGSRYRATANEDVSVDTGVCVCVYVMGNYKVSRAVSKSPINHIMNPNPVYSHSIT
jgi:hypothetical protein